MQVNTPHTIPIASYQHINYLADKILPIILHTICAVSWEGIWPKLLKSFRIVSLHTTCPQTTQVSPQQHQLKQGRFLPLYFKFRPTNVAFEITKAQNVAQLRRSTDTRSECITVTTIIIYHALLLPVCQTMQQYITRATPNSADSFHGALPGQFQQTLPSLLHRVVAYLSL